MAQETLKDGSRVQGVVTKAVGSSFNVLVDSRTITCFFRGRYRIQKGDRPESSSATGTFPVVGDQVILALTDQSSGVIEEILPRETKLSRKEVELARDEQVLVANIQQMVIVSSVKLPALKTRVIDRFLIAAEKGELQPVICVNKIDLASDENYKQGLTPYLDLGYRVILTSVPEKRGLDDFKECLKGRISVLAGQSGVGKSSLLNAIQRGLRLATREVSTYSLKGKHATSHVELYPLDFGGFVADTPGLRLLGLWDIEKGELASYFPEFEDCLGKCKFNDCLHLSEPGCAVKEKLEDGKMHKSRYESYKRILETL
jgi:ribosome biogenesis GTPase